MLSDSPIQHIAPEIAPEITQDSGQDLKRDLEQDGLQGEPTSQRQRSQGRSNTPYFVTGLIITIGLITGWTITALKIAEAQDGLIAAIAVLIGVAYLTFMPPAYGGGKTANEADTPAKAHRVWRFWRHRPTA